MKAEVAAKVETPNLDEVDWPELPHAEAEALLREAGAEKLRELALKFLQRMGEAKSATKAWDEFYHKHKKPSTDAARKTLEESLLVARLKNDDLTTERDNLQTKLREVELEKAKLEGVNEHLLAKGKGWGKAKGDRGKDDAKGNYKGADKGKGYCDKGKGDNKGADSGKCGK